MSSGLTDPNGAAFTAGQLKDTGNTTGSIALYSNRFTEIEFAIQATTNATAGGDYCFQLYNSTSGAVLNGYTYAQVRVLGATAIDLLSFEAQGDGEEVRVGWTTAQESDNKGFNLYRAQSLGGPYVQLNANLIASQSLGGEGRDYEFIDTQASRGAIYYYKLEDVDASGTHTPNGPVCVDWDGDGIPDDWELAYGLNPGVNDAALDSDGDGVSNLLEYQRGTNPRLRDTNGDGVADGAEKKNPGYSGGSVSSLSADASVQVLASDARGMTLELATKSFDVTPVEANGEAFERLRVPGYVHGFTLEPGLPQVPLKGMLIEIPAGKVRGVGAEGAACAQRSVTRRHSQPGDRRRDRSTPGLLSLGGLVWVGWVRACRTGTADQDRVIALRRVTDTAWHRCQSMAEPAASMLAVARSMSGTTGPDSTQPSTGPRWPSVTGRSPIAVDPSTEPLVRSSAPAEGANRTPRPRISSRPRASTALIGGRTGVGNTEDDPNAPAAPDREPGGSSDPATTGPPRHTVGVDLDRSHP